jgi:hypothetical protein
MSSVERLLIELAPSESRRSLDNLITAAARKGLLDVFKLNAALERHKRRPGAAKLRGVAKYYLPREDGKSGLERSFHAARAKDPEIPAPATNVYIAGWEIDCWWPALRVALELDGRPYHVAVADTEKDRIKDAKLMAMGIWPMRITDRRWEFDQQGALADLRAVLRRREADGRLGLEQAGPLRPEEEGRREAA